MISKVAEIIIIGIILLIAGLAVYHYSEGDFALYVTGICVAVAGGILLIVAGIKAAQRVP